MTHLLLFLVAFCSWSLNTLASGGGSLVLVATLSYVIPIQDVAPVVAIASLIAGIGRTTLSWRHIAWDVVRWYTPGAVIGAIIGAWTLTLIEPALLQLVMALFLVSTAWQYRLGRRERSFRMTLPGFVPVSFVVGLISAVVGASGVIALPFYLNYGLVKERMLATRAANSLLLQVAKLVSYVLFGLLNRGTAHDGVIAGIGTVAAMLATQPLLDRITPQRFRQLAVVMMFVTGLLMLWRHRRVVADVLAAMRW